MIGEDYFYWLCNRAAPPGYLKLLTKLADTNYIWQFQLDSNRAKAGTNLRDDYAYEEGVYRSDVADGPCSCLEMLVALSIDISEQSGAGDERKFFSELLNNLNLLADDDSHYNESEVNYILERWLNRTYSPGGSGNIFYTMNSSVDMRKIDIWQQMMIYINEEYPLDQNFLHE